MYRPRVILTFLIIKLIVTAEVANGFAKLNSQRRLWTQNAIFKLSESEIKWIDQPLDHFDSNEKRILKMRYCENLDLWQPHGPIIISIGGESYTPWLPDSAPDYNDGMGLVVQLAEETNAALFGTEHRYYGSTKPDISQNNITEYYKFLSSQQALADIANLIKFLKSDPKYKTSKVVAIGGSYPGNLAVWLRELYPELVDAAVAASAPVLAKKDFKEYLDVVRYAFRKYGGEKCLKDMENYYRRIEEFLKSSKGIEIIKREFDICPHEDLTVFRNQQLLFSNIYIDTAGQFAQFETPKVIKKACNRMKSKHGSLIDGPRPGPRCRHVDFNSTNFTDPWTYQFCTEFGYLPSTTLEIQPFVHWNPLEFCLKFCKDLIQEDVIEKRIDEGVARTNQMYGGKRPNVTKVVFTHGDMDPWRALGVVEDLGPDAPAFVINGTSHCGILVASDDEPKELTENREYVKNLVKKWISSP